MHEGPAPSPQEPDESSAQDRSHHAARARSQASQAVASTLQLSWGPTDCRLRSQGRVRAFNGRRCNITRGCVVACCGGWRSRLSASDRLFRLAALSAGCAPPVRLPRAPFNLLLSPSDWTVVAAFTTHPDQGHRAAVHRRSGHNRALGMAEVARGREPETNWRVWHGRRVRKANIIAELATARSPSCRSN